MAQVRLELKQRTDAELRLLAQNHARALEGNPLFPAPEPPVPEFAAVLAEFAEVMQECAVLEAELQGKYATKLEKRAALIAALAGRGNYVQATSHGEESAILSAAFAVRARVKRVGELAAPESFLPEMGPVPGVMAVSWGAVRGARAYVLEYRLEAEAEFTGQHFTTRRSALVAGLVSGQTYVFRVAAVGADGQGPWSIESARMAP